MFCCLGCSFSSPAEGGQRPDERTPPHREPQATHDPRRGCSDRALPGIVRDIRESSVGRWIDERSEAGQLTQDRVQDLASGVAAAAGGALGVATSTFGLVFTFVTALFMTIFLLLDLPRLQSTLDGLLTPAQSQR